MKKFIYTIFAAGALLMANSCDKILEKTPDGQITIDKVITNHASTQGLNSACYAEIYSARDQITFVMQTIDDLTDNTFWAATYNSYEWHNGALSLSNPVINWPWNSPSEQLWPDFWRGIRHCNNALLYLPQAYELGTITETECNRWMDEAVVLRAWFYMNLMEFYGPVPYITEPLSANFDYTTLVRPTYQDLTNDLVDDLDDVCENDALPDRWPVSERKHVDKSVAKAIKARILLNNASPLNNPNNDSAKWVDALEAALALTGDSTFDLIPGDQYKTLFCQDFNTDNKEIIWRSWNDNTAINGHNAVDVGEYTDGGKSVGIAHVWNCGESPTQELVDCFELTNGALPVTYDDDTHTKVTVTAGAKEMGYSEAKGGDPYANRDMRFYNDIVYNMCDYGVPSQCTDHYIVETYVGGKNGFNDVISQETQKSCTGYYNRKDTQIENFGPNGSYYAVPGTHWVFFRLAEFYLNAAECYCELNDRPNAEKYLNKVRVRAGQPEIKDVPDYKDDQEWLRNRIRNERRVEFCMEGWRFHDQRRWKILSKTNKFVTGMRITKEGTDPTTGKPIFSYERKKIRDYQSYTDKYLVMPIPLTDAKKMPNVLQPEAWR